MAEPKKSGIDRIYARIKSHGMDSLTDAERSMFAVHWLFLEAYNGGLHQFFFNDSGQLAVPALRGLEAIGAIGTADVLRRAIALFPGGEIPTDQLERRTVLLEFPDSVNESLAGLEKEFDRVTNEESVAELMDDYVKSHLNLFPVLVE